MLLLNSLFVLGDFIRKQNCKQPSGPTKRKTRIIATYAHNILWVPALIIYMLNIYILYTYNKIYIVAVNPTKGWARRWSILRE